MRTIRFTSRSFPKAAAALRRRAVPADDVREAVAAIVAGVRDGGDRALFRYAAKFDGAKLTAADVQVSAAEMRAAGKAVDAPARKIIAASHRNVLAFAQRSLRKDWSMVNAQGAEVGERFDPFQRVGVYVPGGTAPLVSTAIMTVTLAQAAGVPEIVACTPAGRDGTINPALLHALAVAGATEVYKVGGAHAVAALAYGTESIAPVTKVFGPGNRFVVEAKRQVVGAVAIDLLPGPSEVLVLADASGRADFIAADLLAQAEHGGDSQVVFVTDSADLLDAVQKEVRAQAKALTRQDAVGAVLRDGFTCVLVRNLDQGVDIANDYAPEHLTLIARREKALLRKIRTAGAVFLGNYSPVAAGDFLAGPSHTLPTGGAGHSFPGLTADMFQKRTSIVRLDREAARKSAPVIEAFSALEGLDAHGRSAIARLD